MAKKIRKGEKVLKFIKKAGKRGRRFTEIQRFIMKINRPYREYDSGTTDRGYYCSALCGTYSKKGLLEQFCIKNDRGRWVCPEIPEGAIYGSRFSSRVLSR